MYHCIFLTVDPMRAFYMRGKNAARSSVWWTFTCGSSMAVFSSARPGEDMARILKETIARSVTFGNKARRCMVDKTNEIRSGVAVAAINEIWFYGGSLKSRRWDIGEKFHRAGLSFSCATCRNLLKAIYLARVHAYVVLEKVDLVVRRLDETLYEKCCQMWGLFSWSLKEGVGGLRTEPWRNIRWRAEVCWPIVFFSESISAVPGYNQEGITW